MHIESMWTNLEVFYCGQSFKNKRNIQINPILAVVVRLRTLTIVTYVKAYRIFLFLKLSSFIDKKLF